MITKDDLKSLLGRTFDLTDAHVEALLPLAQERTVANNEILYKQGDPAENFYLLVEGKVILEAELAPGVTASLNSIKPGYVFAWSALIGGTHDLQARAVEVSDLLFFESSALIELMRGDHDLGYRIIRSMLRLMKDRLDARTGQFLRIMARHPDLQLGG